MVVDGITSRRSKRGRPTRCTNYLVDIRPDGRDFWYGIAIPRGQMSVERLTVEGYYGRFWEIMIVPHEDPNYIQPIRSSP